MSSFRPRWRDRFRDKLRDNAPVNKAEKGQPEFAKRVEELRKDIDKNADEDMKQKLDGYSQKPGVDRDRGDDQQSGVDRFIINSAPADRKI